MGQSVSEVEEEIAVLERQARVGGPLGSWAQQEAIRKRATLQLDPAIETSYPDDNVWTPPAAEVPELTKANTEPSLEDQLTAAKKVVKSIKAQIAERDAGARN